MEPGTAILAAAGAVGAFVLYKRWQQGQPAGSGVCGAVGAVAGYASQLTLPPAPPTGAPPGQVDAYQTAKEQAASKASQLAQTLCQLNILNSLDEIHEALFNVFNPNQRDGSGDRAKNLALNGAVTDAVDPRMPRSVLLRNRPGIIGAGVWGSSITGAVQVPLRHENGCVPYSGHAGAAKCAPGTVMLDEGANRYTRAMGTGTADDPTTVRARSGDPFPLAVPAGAAGYWDKGQPKVCTGGLAQDWSNSRGGALTCTRAPVRPPDGGGSGTATVNGLPVTPPMDGDAPRRWWSP